MGCPLGLRFNQGVADFSPFDRRGYRTVDIRTGYRAWADTYEGAVENAMDIELLEALRTVRWEDAREVAVDLGCGTGRTGAWLAAQGAGAIDGVDLTPEMLERARSRGVFRRLVEADVTATGLPSNGYDLVTTSLVDEHLPDVRAALRGGRAARALPCDLRARGLPPALHHGVGHAHPLRGRRRTSRSRSRPTSTCSASTLRPPSGRAGSSPSCASG